MKKIYFKKKSKTHGFGLYAVVNINKNTKVIEYVGDRVTKKEGDRRADMQALRGLRNKNNGKVYIFELSKRYDIDGFVRYNYARFINHSCKPNCEVQNVKNRLWILSKKKIKKDEELTYNYGYSYDTDYRDHKCNCGSLNCLGYILKREHWHKLNKRKQTK